MPISRIGIIDGIDKKKKISGKLYELKQFHA
jgi:hypothetical protein